MFKKKTCNIHVCHTFSENRTSVQISAHFQLYTQYSSQSCLIMGTRVIILKVNNSRMIQSNFGSKGPNSFKELKKKKKGLQMTSDGKRSHDHLQGRSGGLKAQ